MENELASGRAKHPTLRFKAGDALVRSPMLLVIGLALAFIVTACAQQQEIPPIERRAQEINKVIMCPVCPGESIDQSQNALSKQMRAIVLEKLEAGWTEEQIKAFFVERYGPSVLMEPPRHGFNLLAWVIPPIALVGAGGALYLALRFMRRPRPAPQRQETTSPPLSQEELAGYTRRIEAALGGEDSASNATSSGEPPRSK